MIILFVHLALALAFLIAAMSFQDIFLVLILWCAVSQFHFCHLIVYMIMCLYNWVTLTAAIGLAVQNGSLASIMGKGGANTFMLVMVFLFILFYPVAVYFAFRAYREFKGMLYDNGMGGGSGMGSMLPFGRGSRQSSG